MINHNGEVLNSKTEWNQPRIIRTTIVQGGAEMVGGRVMPCQRAGGPGTASAALAAQQPPATQAPAPVLVASLHPSISQVEDILTSRARRLHARTSG